MFKKIISFFLLLILFPISSFADDIENDISNLTFECSSSISSEEPQINSRSAIILERGTNTILYQKNAFNKVKMASTTKIMTAIIILENINDLNEIVTISKKAAGTGGSRLGIHEDDKISVINLLYGLLLCSGNDAAVALAEYCGNNIQNFSNLMNKKAKDLNLNNSNFITPHGLDNDNHYTTAYELAKLTNYALQNETFRNIVSTKNYTITINNYSKTLSNTNELLGNLNGIYGVKTGFTNGANRCLVTACKRGDLDIISIVLGADTKKFRTQDSIKLIEYTYQNYSITDVSNLVNTALNSWRDSYLQSKDYQKFIPSNFKIKLEENSNFKIPIKNTLVSNLETKVSCNINPDNNLFENSIIGTLTIKSNGITLFTSNIININTLFKKDFYYYLYNFLSIYSQ